MILEQTKLTNKKIENNDSLETAQNQSQTEQLPYNRINYSNEIAKKKKKKERRGQQESPE